MRQYTALQLLQKANDNPSGSYIYDTPGVRPALGEATANNWLVLQEGGRYYLTKAGLAQLQVPA